MGRLAERLVATAEGFDADGELIPWRDVYWVGADIEEGQLALCLEHVLAPAGASRRSWGPREGDDDGAFDADAERILAGVREHCPRAVRMGWLARPSVAWEPVEALPERSDGEATGYRSPAATPILARRIATSLEMLLAWLSGERDAPRELVVTPDHVYARRSSGTWRVPLPTLAERIDYPPPQPVYVFGRRAKLLILHRDGCPVQATLDALLAAKT